MFGTKCHPPLLSLGVVFYLINLAIAAESNCAIEVSNCTLDDKCDGQIYKPVWQPYVGCSVAVCGLERVEACRGNTACEMQVWQPYVGCSVAVCGLERVEACRGNTACEMQGSSDWKSLRFICRYYDNKTLDFEIIRPFVTLKELYVKRVNVPPVPEFARLTKLEIWKGSFLQKGQPIGECRNLETLEIFETHIENLPDGWLSECTKLRTVMIEYVEELQRLPARMLHNANELRELTIRGCNLYQLPSDLILNTPKLRYLDLSYNKLRELPKGFFKNTPYLEKLKLIVEDSSFDAQDELYHLTDINFLMLDWAHKYGICRDEYINNSTYKTAPFNTMPKVEYLSLSWTETKRICPEWPELFPSLKRLNLRDNRISVLQFEDVELIRNNGWEIDLETSSPKATPVGTIELSESDYNAALQNQGNSSAKIILNKYGLMCDCRWFWMIRLLKARPGYISMDDGGCWWADPPGSFNRFSAPYIDVPEWKLTC